MTPEMIVACFKTKECGSCPYQDRCQPRFLKTRVRKEVSWKAEKEQTAAIYENGGIRSVRLFSKRSGSDTIPSTKKR